MIAITGATGQLGHYVIESLMKTVPASQIVAIVRNPAKAQALAAQGITVRQADYGDEAALTSALQGVEKLLLISSSEVGQRAPQHRNVINAAKAAGVKFIAYTSLLHADTSPLGLADEHIETEKMLADSGIVYTLLRNGWYSENYLASAPAALEHGVFIGFIAVVSLTHGNALCCQSLGFCRITNDSHYLADTRQRPGSTGTRRIYRCGGRWQNRLSNAGRLCGSCGTRD